VHRLKFLAFVGPAIVVATLASSATAQQTAPVSAERTGALGAAGITESSGVAVSRRFPGVLWTHNDSGDGPFLYAIDRNGRLIAKYRVSGARAVDWEDIAVGPCPRRFRPAASCLYVADTGDNAERRTRVVLYVMPEPDPRTPGQAVRATRPAQALRVRYADGPHDAEALIVDGHGDVSIVTKGRTGPILRYRIPSRALSGDSVSVRPTDTIPVKPNGLIGRWVTGGAIAPDGERVVLRTYTELYFFRVGPNGWAPEGAPCWIGGLEPQGEGVDFLDGHAVVLTSERGLAAEGTIEVVRCR
jgi:hypothetical protein